MVVNTCFSLVKYSFCSPTVIMPRSTSFPFTSFELLVYHSQSSLFLCFFFALGWCGVSVFIIVAFNFHFPCSFFIFQSTPNKTGSNESVHLHNSYFLKLTKHAIYNNRQFYWIFFWGKLKKNHSIFDQNKKTRRTFAIIIVQNNPYMERTA